jgi:hypothetical protein
MGAAEVEAFLTSLAVDRKVSAATKNQALAALLFRYSEVVGAALLWFDGITRATGPRSTCRSCCRAPRSQRAISSIPG